MRHQWKNSVNSVLLEATRVEDGKALVVLSGGQDSITCLFWALKKYKEVVAINFSYGQRHDKETIIAFGICNSLGVSFLNLDITSIMGVTKSALLEKDSDISKIGDNGLPASFVPNRNQLFLTLAHSYAQTMGCVSIITGVCQTDNSGYPDCRSRFICNLEKVLYLGSEKEIIIETPLMWIDKADTFYLAEKLGALKYVLHDSMTCYEGNETMNDFGKGCGVCPACTLRKAGYIEYLKRYHNGGIS